VVSSFRIFGTGSAIECTVVTKEGAVQAHSNTELSIYDTVEIDIDNGKVVKKEEGKKGRALYKKTMGAIAARIDTGTAPHPAKLMDHNCHEVISKMLPELAAAAGKIVNAFISGAPIVVRYHNDGDGAAGAISLQRAVSKIAELGMRGERQVSWQMNRSVFYTLDSFYLDKMVFESYKSAERPLLVICDFGTAEESRAALSSALIICDIVWIDHHVIPKTFDPCSYGTYINPFNSGGDSKLSAGFVASLLAQMLGADAETLGEAALISDYSAYADHHNREAEKIALVLDYLTSEQGANERKPGQMDCLISDRAEFERTYFAAKSALDEAVASGIRIMKRCKSATGANIGIIKFSDTGIKGYPLPGRYSSRVQHVLEAQNNGNTITIVYYGNYISIRLSGDIKDRTDILGIISRMSSDATLPVSGGGHREAASIKISGNRADADKALSVLLGLLGAAV
jgi:RecJ-like exonuclease